MVVLDLSGQLWCGIILTFGSIVLFGKICVLFNKTNMLLYGVWLQY